MLARVVLAFTSYMSSVQSFNRCATVIGSSNAFSVHAFSESIRSRRSHVTLWMGQSFNAKAVASMGRVCRHPALAIPHLSVDHVGMLDFSGLRDAGCKGIIFDKDNTLTAPYKDSLHPLVEEGVRRCLEAFGECVCIMSNSAGTRDDRDYEDAVHIETSLGIPVLRHDEKKPGGVMDVLAFFEGKGLEGADVRLDELCFVGDRLMTDVVLGNLHGMLTVHTRPLTLRGDNRLAVFFRFLERKVFLGFFRKTCAVKARAHSLCSKEGTPGLRCMMGEISQEPAVYKSV